MLWVFCSPNMEGNVMKIVLGSQAQVKCRALVRVRDKLGLLSAACVYTNGVSGVSEQPSSDLETLHGALNRVNSLVNFWLGCFIIAVENGVSFWTNGWVDFAYVVVRAPDGVITIRRSAEVKVPKELVQVSKDTGWKLTCGQLEADRSGSDSADPHKVWGGRSREDILAEVMEEAMGVAVKTYENRKPKEVVVHFRETDMTVELPVREVSPGVSVALLELYRDPELTEVLGKKLAKQISDKYDFVISPDGKAQALLHVVARETGMIPILARKERKSYMLEPVVSESCESITTKTPHTFYLGADDAEHVKGKNVVILDDVVSQGGTVRTLELLLQKCGARSAQVVCVATEGERRTDVISLTHLEVYK